MSDAQPTTPDHHDPDQPGADLDAAKLPEEIPDRPVAADAYGTTAAEQLAGEGLDRKLRREEPDPSVEAAAGVAPAGGEARDPDAAPPVQADAGVDGRDDVKDLVGDPGRQDDVAADSGRPSVPTSPEEDAVHVYADAPGGTDRRPVRDDEGR